MASCRITPAAFWATSSAGSGRIWEYRVYGDAGVRPQGTFSIADATGGGSDGFIMAPGVGEDVLTLTGNTAQLGSLENQAARRAARRARADVSHGECLEVS